MISTLIEVVKGLGVVVVILLLILIIVCLVQGICEASRRGPGNGRQ